ncbi:MAG: adenylate/guanylate cyclase domain-containing protein, partial [Candidatus Riflebacteria bacterium]|nr:adenylate/guanylate cyclase domain-containing protein [Candidatus Riflebacteria bacterium]
KPTSKYGDLNIAISFDNRVEGINSVFFPKRNKDKDVKKLVTKALNYRSSGRDKTEINNRNIIQEWIFSNDSPFVVMGMAEEKNIDFLKYLTNIILPVLLSYTIILLVLFSGFISIFIKKPINIIKKAIGLLEINNFGATIEAFSNDEFKNITDGFNEMSIAIKQKEQMKRYVSERLLQSVEVNGVQEAGRGKLDKVTILSSDIRNFTGISEKYEPSEIVEMLNSYFTKMQQAISENNGIIDKYIGDAIQAVFYDEPDKENQVIRASKAAIAMRKALKEFNEERKSKGLFTIENGIGIDTDVAITGTIGTAKGRKDFSVNGEVIERAAALEAKTKNTRSKILLSKKSVEELDCHTSSINVGASLVCKDESYSKIVNDNNTNHTPQQTSPCLITKDFDSESVELIDVR